METPFESESPISKKASYTDNQAFDQQQHLQLQQHLQQEMMASNDASRTGPSSQNQSAAKSHQEKVLKPQFNLSVSLFPYPKISGKVIRPLQCNYYCFELSLPFFSLFSICAYLHKTNGTDPNCSQKIKRTQSFPDF